MACVLFRRELILGESLGERLVSHAGVDEPGLGHKVPAARTLDLQTATQPTLSILMFSHQRHCFCYDTLLVMWPSGKSTWWQKLLTANHKAVLQPWQLLYSDTCRRSHTGAAVSNQSTSISCEGRMTGLRPLLVVRTLQESCFKYDRYRTRPNASRIPNLSRTIFEYFP